MSVFRPARATMIIAALAVVLSGCGGGGGDGGTPPKVATSITITPGPNATVQSGGTLQLVATVKDQNGDPMSGQTVTWSTSNGAKATVSPTGLVTGVQVGAATINAAVGTTLFASPLTVIVTAGAAAALTKVADLPTTMGAGTSDSVRVRVTDAQGNLVSGGTVTFAVSGGGSTLSSTTAVTNSAGVAAVSLTIGSAFNQVTTVTASVPGLSAVTFTTTSIAGPPTQLRVTSPKIVIIDQGTTTTVTVALTDAGGNPVSSTGLVDFVARNSAASTNGATVTGAAPGQTFIVAQLSSNASVRDSVLVVVAFPTGPVVLTNLARFDLKADTTFTVPIIVDMRSSGEKLGSTRVQITWDPSVLVYQSDAEGASSVGATVNNTTAVSAGTLTLAVASATGFSGSVEIRRITFRASATVGATTSITLISTELNGVSPTFTNLKPKTLGVVYPLITR